jgi:hypothetical protein
MHDFHFWIFSRLEIEPVKARDLRHYVLCEIVNEKPVNRKMVTDPTSSKTLREGHLQPRLLNTTPNYEKIKIYA